MKKQKKISNDIFEDFADIKNIQIKVEMLLVKQQRNLQNIINININ